MAPLREQIMDELMDRPMSISALAYELGASYEGARQAVRKLEGENLIYAAGVGLVRGKHEVIYAMTRTKRGRPNEHEAQPSTKAA